MTAITGFNLSTEQASAIIGASVEMVREACTIGVMRCGRGEGRCGHYEIPVDEALRFKANRPGFAQALRLARMRNDINAAAKAGTIRADPATGILSAQFDATWLADRLKAIDDKLSRLCAGLGAGEDCSG